MYLKIATGFFFSIILIFAILGPEGLPSLSSSAQAAETTLNKALTPTVTRER
jgi:hypothetical protein